MKQTLILAALIAAALASAPANAYEVTAPPEIVAADKACTGGVRDALVIGRMCHRMLVAGIDDHASCARFTSAGAAITESCDIVLAWVSQAIEDGATTAPNLIMNTKEAQDYSDLVDSIIRVRRY